jgi:proteasome accessory factor B
MDKTERLLDLTALFLDAREPVSFEKIRVLFPDEYGSQNFESALRKFERDKAELVEAGLPLEYHTGSDGENQGYVIRREDYYLEDLKLLPHELASLFSAGAAALESGLFPAREELKRALEKITFFSGRPGASKIQIEITHQPNSLEILDALWEALQGRKFVTISYRSPHALTEVSAQPLPRKVNPLGLALRRGQWNLVAYCFLRQAVRTFLVHRIEDINVNPQQPKVPDFEVPQDFDVRQWVPQFAWEFKMHESISVTLRLDSSLSHLASQLFGKPVDASGEVTLAATHLDALVDAVLGTLGAACLVSPDVALKKFDEKVKRIAAAHLEESP